MNILTIRASRQLLRSLFKPFSAASVSIAHAIKIRAGVGGGGVRVTRRPNLADNVALNGVCRRRSDAGCPRQHESGQLVAARDQRPRWPDLAFRRSVCGEVSTALLPRSPVALSFYVSRASVRDSVQNLRSNLLSFVFFHRRDSHQRPFCIRAMHRLAVVPKCLLRESFWIAAGH